MSSPSVEAMKLFNSIQGPLNILGIRRHQSFQEHPFNLNNATILVILVQFSITSTNFLVIEAKTLAEYVESSYISTTAVMASFIFIVYVYKMENIFELIGNYESVIERRK